MVYNNRTIDEIVRYILQNDGPGEKYRAHPNLKISINELELVLGSLPKELSNLKPYHFQSVRNMWVDKEGKPTEHAREVTGKLINHLVTIGEFTNIDECMRGIKPKPFHSNILFDEINGHKFFINTSVMLDSAYHNSVSRAIRDYKERLAA